MMNLLVSFVLIITTVISGCTNDEKNSAKEINLDCNNLVVKYKENYYKVLSNIKSKKINYYFETSHPYYYSKNCKKALYLNCKKTLIKLFFKNDELYIIEIDTNSIKEECFNDIINQIKYIENTTYSEKIVDSSYCRLTIVFDNL